MSFLFVWRSSNKNINVYMTCSNQSSVWIIDPCKTWRSQSSSIWPYSVMFSVCFSFYFLDDIFSVYMQWLWYNAYSSLWSRDSHLFLYSVLICGSLSVVQETWTQIIQFNTINYCSYIIYFFRGWSLTVIDNSLIVIAGTTNHFFWRSVKHIIK